MKECILLDRIYICAFVPFSQACRQYIWFYDELTRRVHEKPSVEVREHVLSIALGMPECAHLETNGRGCLDGKGLLQVAGACMH